MIALPPKRAMLVIVARTARFVLFDLPPDSIDSASLFFLETRNTRYEMSKKKDKRHDLELAVSSDGGVVDAVVLDERVGHIAHKDLGAIAATEFDGITINRTKSNISPFIDIRKERLIDPVSGAPSRSFGVWVPDPTKPEGWRDMGTVSENYLLLTNKEVRALALEIAAESGHPFKEARIFWDGARFAHIIDFEETREEIAEGDAVGLSLITRTSYDRSWKFEAALMGKRFLCDNGVLSGEFFARVSFKHTGGNDDGEKWKDIVRQGLSVISHSGDNLTRFADGLRILKRHPMSDEHLRGVWQRLPKLGDTLMGKVMRRYMKDEEPTLYGLLNAGTNVFWHNQKMTSADFSNNDTFVSAMLGYAFEHLN
ncbi:DUF932 domain-containing protein [bacterium]|nr:DUF932 domain-containing protein [bacterium]